MDHSQPSFSRGDRIKLITRPPYIKTADPMPSLRSAEILDLNEEGIILDRRPGGYYGVRFAAGAFLLESQYLQLINPH